MEKNALFVSKLIQIHTTTNKSYIFQTCGFPSPATIDGKPQEPYIFKTILEYN